MTQPSLDSILSGRSDAAQETAPPPTIVEKPKEPEATVVEVEASQGQRQEGQDDQSQEQQGQKMVPHEALHAEKQKVKRYTEQVADFERRLNEQNQAWDRRFTELLERVAPKRQEQPADWYQDPDAAFRQHGERLVGPVVTELRATQAQIAYMRGERAFGEQYGAFLDHVREAQAKGDPEIPALAAMMESSPDPYRAAKDWWDKRTFDPAAERERIKAELLQEMGAQQQSQQQPALPVMPSNLAGMRNVGARRGPAWAGPPPLKDIFKR